ncbi:universal stress protein [Amycolatopsis sp. NPDC051758]|uniref:universal stress protein n=1 Tax=Amycolatopsis sp. NPDC051758 TaxID=3363935 RepID=UPI00378CDB77
MTTTKPAVIVAGYDGTQESLRAVFWAAAEADRRQNALLVARALDWNWPSAGYPDVALAPLCGGTERLRREAEIEIGELAHEIGHSHPDLDVRTVLLEDLPGHALQRISTRSEAAMLVIGPPGTGPFARVVFGSTTADLAQAPGRPLVVVRGDEPGAGAVGRPVVVGLDPVADNSAALAFAMDFARKHEVRVHLVHATTNRIRGGGPSEAMVAELADWLSAYPDVPFEHEIVRDLPERALLDRARHAALLVVGYRRRNRFVRLLCGSVSRTVLHYAPCPVSVVGAGT